MKLNLAILIASAFAVSQAPATVIFSDNFNSYNSGSGALNFGSFGGNWSVTDGTVDLIGNGFHDFYPGNGLFIDLDGSTGNAGILTSKALSLTAGNYLLNFDLGGNKRNSGSDAVTVRVDTGIFNTTYTILGTAPLSTYAVPFTVSGAQNINLVFSNAGGDNIGAILDNVQLTRAQVPDGGATIGMLGFALMAAEAMRRRLIR